MVARFRLFDKIPEVDSERDIQFYLKEHTTKPYSKVELIDRAMSEALKETDITKLFRVKPCGRDRDPIFWSFGKIHGLENIAFADSKELLETNGNPVKL